MTDARATIPQEIRMCAPRTFVFLVLVTLAAAALEVLGGQAAPAGASRREFEAMLAKVDAAQLELQNGRAEPFKALWSRADDITLSGGLGGRIEQGWEQIGPRLDWVATQFSKATHTNNRVVTNVGGDLGYVVQTEQIDYHVPGRAEGSTREYRVTMIFRRESGGWRIVHRQADSQTVKPSGR
jgi:ketosteroid isomerase-like protein